MTIPRAAVTATLATLFSTGVTAAIAAQVIDQGVLEIRRNNALVGEEQFRIERTNRRQVAIIVRSTTRYPASARMELTALIELDADGYPIAAQFDNAGPNAARAVVTANQRAVSVQILPEVGENWVANFRRPPGLVFLSEMQFAPFLVSPIPGTEIKGVDLADREVRDVVVTEEGDVTEIVGGRPIRARLVSIASDAGQILLWYVDNRLVKAEIPSIAVSATRREVEP